MIIKKVFLTFSIIFLLCLSISAQNNQITKEDFYSSLENDPDMTLSKSGRGPLSISYGGWLTPMILEERTGKDHNILRTSVTTAKIWLKSTLWANSFIYIRGKDTFMKILKQETDVDDTDNVLDLDVGYIDMSFANNKLGIALGRKFFVLGTGLLFNGRGDGGEINFYSKYLDIMAFGAYTGLLLKDNNPYGLSAKDISDGSKRIFAGGKLQSEFSNQALYLMGLAQIDQGDEVEGEKTRYNSQYYGGGLKGIIASALEYYGEFIYETGKSYVVYTDSTSGDTLYKETDICAYAGSAGINLYFDILLNPALILQYYYGSGDKNRRDNSSPTRTPQKDGASYETNSSDMGFITFGTFIGGYALRPLLSNIHVAKAGFALSPFSFSSSTSLKRLGITVKYSYYLKDKKEGVVNYGGADETDPKEREIGHGVDSSVRWKIFSDLSFFATYAIFIPGKAYDSKEENRHFAMAGFNLLF